MKQEIVNRELSEWDIDSLKNIYETAQMKFQEALINGADWNEVQQQRQFLVDISIAIHTREPHYFRHPAASESRRNSSQP